MLFGGKITTIWICFFFKRPLSTSILKNFQNHSVDYSCWDFLSVISKYIVQNVWLAIWYQYPGMSYHDLWMILWCRADSSELKHSLQKVERKSPNSRSKQTSLLWENRPSLRQESHRAPPQGYRCSKQMLGHRLSCWATEGFFQPDELLASCPESSSFCELTAVLVLQLLLSQ